MSEQPQDEQLEALEAFEPEPPVVEVQAEEYVDNHPPRPARPNRGDHKSHTQITAEVWAGWWGDENGRAERLSAAGFDSDVIQNLVDRGVGKLAGERLASS